MATSTARLHAELTAEDQMTKVFKKVGDASKKLQEGFKGIQQDAGEFGKVFGVVAGAGVFALKNFVDQANESERVTSQLNAVLKSTSGVAGVTSEMALNLAGSLQKVTTIGDEAILSGENMLLTFTNIGKDVFPQTTEVMLDMATAMNAGVTPSAEALKAQAIQLGKALNDPAEGLSALSRVGVKFTEQQERQIKTMQKHGDIMGAQKLILGELSREFGGSAKAAAQTFSGQLEQMQNRMGEIAEELGRAVIPIMKELTAKLGDLVTWFENLTPSQKEFIAQTILVGTALAGAVAGAGLLIAALNPITLTVAAVVLAFSYLSAKLAESNMSWEEFGVSVQVVWAEFWYWTEYYVDLAIWKLRQLTLATDKELKDLAASMDENLQKSWGNVAVGYDKLNQLHSDKMSAQKKIIEDQIAAQRDIVDKSTGDMRDSARKKLEAMKEEGLKQFSDLKLGSTAELAQMRKAEATELDRINAIANEKFAAQAQSALVWGQHLIQNLSSGIWAKMPILGTAIAGAQAIMNRIHQSYNPELPAQLWGEHFLENFVAGMKDSQPKVFAQTEEMKKALKAVYGSDGEVSRIMKEWAKDKSIQENFTKIAEEVKAHTAELQKQFNDQKAEYQDLNLKAGESLAALKTKHQDELSQINQKIKETQDKIKDLNDNYKIDIQGVDTSVGEKVVEQQDLVQQLQDQIAAAIKGGDDTSQLQAKLEKEKTALEDFMKSASGYEDEINEARRRAGLTDFQRFIEDANLRKVRLALDHEEKLAMLDSETAALEDQRTKENAIYAEKLAQYDVVKAGFVSMQTTFTTGLSTMAVTAQQKVDFINTKLAQMRAAMAEITALQTPQELTSSSTSAPKKFATGGVVDRPTLAMIGEGSMNEAVVPLPNGRSIPVEISGSRGGQIVVTFNFGDINISKEVDGDRFIAKMKEQLTREIQLQQLASL